MVNVAHDMHQVNKIADFTDSKVVPPQQTLLYYNFNNHRVQKQKDD